MQWFTCLKLSNTLTVNLVELYLGYQTSDSSPNRLSLLSITCHCLELKKKMSSADDVKESNDKQSDIEGMLYCKHIMLSIYHNKTTFYLKFFNTSDSVDRSSLIVQMLNVV